MTEKKIINVSSLYIDFIRHPLQKEYWPVPWTLHSTTNYKFCIKYISRKYEHNEVHFTIYFDKKKKKLSLEVNSLNALCYRIHINSLTVIYNQHIPSLNQEQHYDISIKKHRDQPGKGLRELWLICIKKVGSITIKKEGVVYTHQRQWTLYKLYMFSNFPHTKLCFWEDHLSSSTDSIIFICTIIH